MKALTIILIIYLSISFLIAMTEIFTVAGYERTRDSLPYGDSYLVEMPTTPLDFLAIRILFLPATLMVCIWVGFCRIVNNIIN